MSGSSNSYMYHDYQQVVRMLNAALEDKMDMITDVYAVTFEKKHPYPVYPVLTSSDVTGEEAVYQHCRDVEEWSRLFAAHRHRITGSMIRAVQDIASLKSSADGKPVVELAGVVARSDGNDGGLHLKEQTGERLVWNEQTLTSYRRMLPKRLPPPPVYR